MPLYTVHRNAGEVPYESWRQVGIEIPIFDKDGTLSDASGIAPIHEVIVGLKAQHFPDIFPNIALATNNYESEHISYFVTALKRSLGVSVDVFSQSGGHDRKPSPDMGFAVAKRHSLTPDQLGVIGDRRFTDVEFGMNLGAGAIALCRKVGRGDEKWVPALRVLEAGVVGWEMFRGLAKKAY